MTPRASSRLKIWLVMVGVFVLGAATGVLLDSVYRLRASGNARQEARGARHGEEMIEHMKSDLSLSDQQVTQIRSILDQTRNDYRALSVARCRNAGDRQRAPRYALC